MEFKPQNAVFDEAVEKIRSVPTSTPVTVPWARNLGWTAQGKVGALMAHAAGALGVSRSERGDYKLYYGRKNAGSWCFEVWGAWKSLVVAAVLLYLVRYGFVVGKTNATANLIGIAAAFASVMIFGGKARYALWASSIYDAAAKGGYVGAMWVAVFTSLVGASAILGSGLRLLDGGVSYGFPVGVLPDVFGQRGIRDVLGSDAQALLGSFHSPWMSGLKNVLATGVGLVAARGAAWVFDKALLVHISRHSSARMAVAANVPGALFRESGSGEFAMTTVGSSGGYVLLCGMAMFVAAALLFLAY